MHCSQEELEVCDDESNGVCVMEVVMMEVGMAEMVVMVVRVVEMVEMVAMVVCLVGMVVMVVVVGYW